MPELWRILFVGVVIDVAESSKASRTIETLETNHIRKDILSFLEFARITCLTMLANFVDNFFNILFLGSEIQRLFLGKVMKVYKIFG